MQLSKSDCMLYLRHPAWLWVKKHDPSKIPPVSEATQAMFDTGFLFENYAEQRFANAVRLGFDDYDSYQSLPERTQSALNEGTQTILQGRFEYGNYTFICDVIDVVQAKTIDLYEIKSSTGVKQEHIYDLAYQVMVLQGCGYSVRDVYVLHVNNQYVRSGEVDASQIVTCANVTDEVLANHAFTIQNATAALSTANSPTMPDPSPSNAKLGSLGEWLKIYRNINNVPENSIYDLATPGAKRLGELEAMGIQVMENIPNSFELTPKQQAQVRVVKSGLTYIDEDSIRTFLSTFEYPLYFLDYETYSGLVPYFDGQKPYEQVPFQYSLHVLDNPGSDLRHVEYLHRNNSNPVEELSASLQGHIGSNGTVITWNKSFEMSCNNRMGALAPNYAPFYEALNARVVDLMEPFKNDWYVDKDFLGSASIKKVLPVLVPQLSYKVLGIQEGNAAQRLWMEAVLDGKRDGDKDQILADLVEYCKLDTLAMVEIFKVLRRL